MFLFGKRQDTLFLKKNISRFIALGIGIVGSVSLLYILWQVDPAQWTQWYYAPFFLNIFVVVGSSIYALSKRFILSALISGGLIGILVLRLFEFRDWYYSVLTVLIVLCLSYFFTITETNDNLPPKNTDFLDQKDTNLND